MRLLLGIVLGVFLTIGIAYVNDHVTTDVAARDARTTRSSIDSRKPWVNWDVVDRDLRGFTVRVRHAWNELASKLKS